jgi:UDP-N-acetylglucosamine:LPS N-acetylglucosamine transferase
LRLFRTVADLVRLILSFRPHVIITTGAAPGLLALLIGKVAGSRTIWIDSIANASCMSLSGRISRYCADECLVQWKHLAVGRRAPRYMGSVL